MHAAIPSVSCFVDSVEKVDKGVNCRKSRIFERMENFQNDCCRSWTKKPFKNSYSRQLRIVNAVVCWSPAGQIDWHMYSYFLFHRDSPPKSSPTFSVQPCSSVGRVTVDLIRRSWVRFPPRPKDSLFTSCGSLIPFTRANTQWVIHGFN